MLISLLAGIILGVILALPPGPVAFTAMKIGLNKGLKEGTLVGMGTGIIDFFYCLIASFTASAVLLVADNFAKSYPLVTLITQLVIVLGIMIYGFTHLKPKKEAIDSNTEPLAKKNAFLKFLTAKGPFFLGIAVALANIANPTFMASLAYFAMNIQKFGLIENTTMGHLAFSLGFGIGNLLWIYFLVRTIIHYKPIMSPETILKIQKFAGVTLIGFGTFLGYRILEFTKWSEIIRLVFAL